MLKVLVPICFIGIKDMSVWSDGYFRIETACRYYYEWTFLLDVRQCRTAFRAKTFYMPACLVIEGFNEMLSCQPMQRCGCRKKICSMGWACVLTTVSAMAEVEALKITEYLECDLPTKTWSFVFIHTWLLLFMMTSSWCIVQRSRNL